MPSTRLTYVSSWCLGTPFLGCIGARSLTNFSNSAGGNRKNSISWLSYRHHLWIRRPFSTKYSEDAYNWHFGCRYNTKSNNVRVIKTPGGKLRYLHIKKKGSAPKCGDCGLKLPGVSDILSLHGRWCLETDYHEAGRTPKTRWIDRATQDIDGLCGTQNWHWIGLQIPALRPREYATISRPKKTVQRAYGGSRCANCVKDRVVRAFLIEEQKIVKKVLKESQQKKR